ncbi:MAG: DUF928 domain-containing protein [Cyanobacteria bacterium J06649_5]
MKSCSLAITLTTAVLSAISSLAVSSSLPAAAQDLPPLPIQFEGRRNWLNPGQPGGRRRGGGARGSCQTDRPLTALAYADSTTSEELGVVSTDENVGSLTTQSQPVLWFYLPEAISSDRAPELIIKNSREDVLFQGAIAGQTDDSGIIGVPMAISLEPEETYRWFLTLECDESESTTVNGWIERRPPNSDLSRTFSQANPRNRVALYANYGYVQDALSELVSLRLTNPDDAAISQTWNAVLTQLDRTDLTDAPLLDCCQIASAEGPRLEEAIPEATEVNPSESIYEEEAEDAEEVDSRSVLQRARDKG